MSGKENMVSNKAHNGGINGFYFRGFKLYCFTSPEITQNIFLRQEKKQRFPSCVCVFSSYNISTQS